MKIFLEIEVSENAEISQERVLALTRKAINDHVMPPYWVSVETCADPGEEYNRGYDVGRDAGINAAYLTGERP